MHFDRFDICESYLVFETDWNQGGWLHERESNIRRKEATHVQLSRMHFSARPNLTFETLTENGQEIYLNLQKRYRL
jgi:hypothetical protein